MKLQIDELGKVSITVEAEYWNRDKAYEKLTIVSVEDEYRTFLSRKPVPSNTELTNRQYWIPFSNLKEEIVLNYNAFKAYVLEQLENQLVIIDNKFAEERARIDELFAQKSLEIDVHIRQLDEIVEQQSSRLDGQDRDIQALSDRMDVIDYKLDHINSEIITPIVEEIIRQYSFVIDEHYVHTDNNYSNEDKTKLHDLPTNVALTQLLNDITNRFASYYTKQETYNQTEIDNKVKAVSDALNTLIGTDDVTVAIDTFNEIKDFLADFDNTEDLKDLFDAIELSIKNWADLRFVQTSHLYDNIYNKLEVDNKILQVSNRFSDYLTASVIASTYLTAANAQLLYQPKGTYLTPNDVDSVPVAGSNNPIKSGAVKSALDEINEKIPSAASSSNQLADKAFVNSSIATNTGVHRGTYNVVTDLAESVLSTNPQIALALDSVISTANNNDYCYVQIPVSDDNPTVIAQVRRFKYNGTAWGFEFVLNNSGYTQAQWDAINSTITSGHVAKLNALPTNTELLLLLNALLSKTEAETLYQPKGNYATSHELDDVIEDVEENAQDISQNVADIRQLRIDLTNAQLANAKIISKTYDELKALYDQGALIEGCFYRITDYVTTTARVDTRSAGHRFDVIVVALDSSTLCENAYAMKHEYPDDYIPSDTSAADYQEKYDEVHYFDGIPLEAWRLKYCLDNDTDRFNWAVTTKCICVTRTADFRDGWYNRNTEADNPNGDYKFAWSTDSATRYTATENPAIDDIAYDSSVAASATVNESIIDICNGGKGVIYHMIDENNNDCCYDFKNILYHRYRWTTEIIMPSSYIDDATYNHFAVRGIKNIADMLTSTSGREMASLRRGVIDGNPVLGSTLTDSYVDGSLNTATIDTSSYYLKLNFVVGNNAFAIFYVRIIGASYLYTFNYDITPQRDATIALKQGVYNNKIGLFVNNQKSALNIIVFEIANSSNYGVYNNEIGNGSFKCTFGQNCHDNKINCIKNVIAGYSFYNNTLHGSFQSVIIFSSFFGNSIGTGFGVAIINSNASNNIIGSNVGILCFGKNCKTISINGAAQYIYFGSDIRAITFGQNTINVYFGDDIKECTFADCIQNLVLGTNEKEPQSHFSCIQISVCNLRLKINCTDTTSSSTRCRFIYIPKNINYDGQTYKQLDVSANNNYCTTFERSNDVITQIN